MYPLLNAKSKLSIDNKLKLIKTMLIPIATYAGEMWHQATENQKNLVQSKINRTIRFAVGTPRYITNQKLQEELHIETLDEIIYRRTKHSGQNENSCKPIHSKGYPTQTHTKKRRYNTNKKKG